MKALTVDENGNIKETANAETRSIPISDWNTRTEAFSIELYIVVDTDKVKKLIGLYMKSESGTATVTVQRSTGGGAYADITGLASLSQSSTPGTTNLETPLTLANGDLLKINVTPTNLLNGFWALILQAEG